MLGVDVESLLLIAGLEAGAGALLLGVLLGVLTVRRVRMRTRRRYALYELHLSPHDEAKPQDLEDMVEAISTAISAEHRIYIAGWSTNKDTVLKGTSTLENYLSNTRAQIRGMFFHGVMGLSPLLSTKVVENKYYAKGVGLVFEEKVKGGKERVELVEYKPA